MMQSDSSIACESPIEQPPRLALKPAEAARSLGIGSRLLWSLTNQGRIPHVRLGEKRIVYPVHLLSEWLAKQAQKNLR